MTARIGDRLRDRYELREFLGRGGMSDVYLAFDTHRQVEVAVKVLREDLAEDTEFIRRFRREAEALAQLDHPNIVRFYSFERQGTVAFIVMDYVSGATLRRRLAEVEGQLSVEETTAILRPVAAALQYAHNEGYVHRDIKPGNIMLRDDGTVLLSDFGIARATEAVTMTTGPIGTPAYMSPEQILGQSVDRRTDVYSLGVVLYEMLAGRRPFTGETGTGATTIDRVRDEHLRATPIGLSTLNPAVTQGMAQIVSKAMAKDPARRWTQVKDLLTAWENASGLGETATTARQRWGAIWAAGMSIPAAVRSPASSEPVAAQVVAALPGGAKPPTSRNKWMSLAAAGALAVISLLILLVLSRGLSSTAEEATALPAVTAPVVDRQATALALAAVFATETAEVSDSSEGTLKVLVQERTEAAMLAITATATSTAQQLAATVTSDAHIAATQWAQQTGVATIQASATRSSQATAEANLSATTQAQETDGAIATAQAMAATATAMAHTSATRSSQATFEAKLTATTQAQETAGSMATTQAIAATATAAAQIPTATPTRKPTPIAWLPIPGGEFLMGSSDADLGMTLDECNATEGQSTGQLCQSNWFKEPQRRVWVGDFETTKFEITNLQYNACVAAGVCAEAGRAIGDTNIRRDPGFFALDYPVMAVNWYDADTYCRWIGGRLPSEEEWERAARGSDGRRYPWGNSYETSRANLSSSYPAPVGAFPAGASPYGVMDLAGNVFEWTATMDENGMYVVRGGGWTKYFFRGRVTDRGTWLEPSFANYDVGFRCVR